MHSDAPMKVLVTDSLSKEGIEILESAGLIVKMDPSLDGEKLAQEIGNYDGLVIRSGTTVTKDVIESAVNLKVIGRAGAGVDNIDVQAATRKGIIVMNTPGGNTISACEHTWALILSVMRNVPQAHQALNEGRWDKKKYKGVELYGKTMGVIGLGKIGLEVARRALGFAMNVIIYDPYASEEMIGEVKGRRVELEELLQKSDIITIHSPLNEKTKNMINAEAISKMKKNAYLINCARGGIVNEEALAEAVSEGRIKGAAVDVYPKEPTTESPVFSIPNIINTPHLGASTVEAQDRVSVEIVRQVIGYLNNGKIVNAVNIPGADLDKNMAEIAYKLGKLSGQFSKHLTERLIISYKDTIDGAKEDAVTRIVLNGYLSQFNEGVNLVNAILLAKEKGIAIIKQKESQRGLPGDISVSLNEEIEVSAGVFGNIQRLTSINGYNLDIPLTGNLIVIKNFDKPGVIGHIGTVLGQYGVNIGNMEVGRKSAGGQVITVIGVDQKVSEEVIEKIKSQETIEDVMSVEVGQ
jgi:D-3-phosphoglycerate dehydrogenase